jgi:pyridoxal phosphate enzyme (YggS family)
MIESVDSVKLIRTIQKEAAKADCTVNILLQVKIASEETKYGFDRNTIDQELKAAGALGMDRIRYRGVMGMASFVDDTDQVRGEFRLLNQVFHRLKTTLFRERPEFDQISMGMSGDYRIAVAEGSTMVRIGSLIFGERLPAPEDQ